MPTRQEAHLVLEQAINEQPLIVTPSMPLTEVIHQMSQDWGRSCQIAEQSSDSESGILPTSQPSCALVVEADKLKGIFTERDLVERIAAGLPLQTLSVGEVMTHPVITWQQDALSDVFTALSVMQQHHIRHLPILTPQGKLKGLLTPQGIRSTLAPTDLLQLRQVAEVMETEIIHASPSTSVVEITQLMIQHRCSSIILADPRLDDSVTSPEQMRQGDSAAIATQCPIGIITERDIIQLQLLELPLAEIEARTVMSHPLFSVTPGDSLWTVHQQMQQHHVRRLVVVGQQGELIGSVSQFSLLQLLDPVEMQEVTETLRDRLKHLETQNQQLLQSKTERLEEAVITERSKSDRRRQILSNIAQGTVAQIGSDFFRSLVEHLSKALVVDYAVIGEITAQGDRIRIKAIYGKGEAQDNFEYDLAGTPCANVVGKQRCTYAAQVSQQFPKDKLLQDLNIEGYLGTPLTDSQGTPLGLLMIMSCHPLQELELMEEVLTIFAARAGGELERQQALAEQDRFFSLSLDMLCICGMDGYFRRLNPAFEETLGYSQAELRAEPLLSFVHPDDRAATVAEVESLAAGQPTISFENRYRTKDGSYRWFLWSATPYIKEELLYAAARDITDRKQAEVKLAQQVHQQSVLARLSLSAVSQKLDAFMDEVVEQVAQTLGVNYCKILELSEDRESLLLKAGTGWQPGLVGRASISTELSSQAGYTLQQSAPVIVDDLRRETRFDGPNLLHDHQVISGMSVVIPGNGTFYGVMGAHSREHREFSEEESRFLQSVVNILSNTIERKRAEAKIIEQASLLEVATDAIVLYDLEHRIRYWNHGAERIYGWSTSEAIGQDAHDLLHFSPPPELSDIEQSMAEKGEWQGELSNQRSRGEETLMVQSRWSFVRDEAGNPKAILVVNTDITENKQLETQFLRAQRLESIGTLAGGIAHDLNNILTPILGVSQLLSYQLTNAGPQTNHLLKILEGSAKRGSSLVNQVLTFSRGVEGDRVIAQLRHLASEIQQIAAETFPKSIEFSCDIPKDLWPVSGDVTQLHQVLMNLCVNARDAMPHGGTLKMTAANLQVDKSYARMNLEAKVGPYTVLNIADTGSGIEPALLEKIFDPFFTTKEVGHGTGLGLATVRSIVRSHGGFIQIASELNQGTVVEIFLPAVQSEKESVTPPVCLPNGNGELILVVDDEASIREVTQATLETFNYCVLIAQDGIEAIALYAEHKNDIAIVIMDVMMPTMDGTVAVQTLRRMNPDVKVIMSSGLASNQAIAKSLSPSVKTFLLKPFTAETLLQKVSQVLRDELSLLPH